MPAQNVAIHVHDLTFVESSSALQAFFQEVSVMPCGNEADFLAFFRESICQAGLPGPEEDLFLQRITERK